MACRVRLPCVSTRISGSSLDHPSNRCSLFDRGHLFGANGGSITAETMAPVFDNRMASLERAGMALAFHSVPLGRVSVPSNNATRIVIPPPLSSSHTSSCTLCGSCSPPSHPECQCTIANDDGDRSHINIVDRSLPVQRNRMDLLNKQKKHEFLFTCR